LTTPDEGDGGTQQTPPPSVDEAEDKVVTAYDLIEAQIAHQVIQPNVRKASLASNYVKQYSTGEMKLAAENLRKVGTAGKSAGGVRVSRRSGLPSTKTAGNASDMGGIDSQCLFI